MVNLKACTELIKDLLAQLPKRFENQHDPYSSLGAALQAGFKLLVRKVDFNVVWIVKANFCVNLRFF